MAFRYEVFDDILDPNEAKQIASMVRAESRWKLHQEWFFSQYDLSWVRRCLGQEFVGDLVWPLESLYNKGKAFIETELDAFVGDQFTIVLHKMVPGQVVGIHNDSPDNDRGQFENFRLIYYLDDQFSDDKGGHLLFFDSREVSSLREAVRPIFNSAALLALSNKSYHAVSRVQKEDRLCVVVSYWGYPLLTQDYKLKQKVRASLSKIVRSGLEWKEHSGTSFAYHLYNTYAMLVGWGASPDVCLAGLMHSTLGRNRAGIENVGISRSELEEILGSEATEIVEALASSDLSIAQESDAAVKQAVLLVEIANIIEQADSKCEMERARQLCSWITNINYRNAAEQNIAALEASLSSRGEGGKASRQATPHRGDGTVMQD